MLYLLKLKLALSFKINFKNKLKHNLLPQILDYS